MASSSTPAERSPTSRSTLALVLWAALAALQIATGFALGGGDASSSDTAPIYEWTLGIGSLFLYAVLVLLTLGIARAYPDTRDALGLRRFPARTLWSAGAVVIGSLVLSAALEPILHAGKEQGLAPEEWRADRLAPFLFNAVIIATVVPFAEELFFRGLGVRVLRVFGGAAAVGGTALVFGLAHGLLVALPPLVVFGLGLAWVRLRSDSVWPGVVAHALYNGIGIALAAAAAGS